MRIQHNVDIMYLQIGDFLFKVMNLYDVALRLVS
jgi:hypothetical protein